MRGKKMKVHGVIRSLMVVLGVSLVVSCLSGPVSGGDGGKGGSGGVSQSAASAGGASSGSQVSPVQTEDRKPLDPHIKLFSSAGEYGLDFVSFSPFEGEMTAEVSVKVKDSFELKTVLTDKSTDKFAGNPEIAFEDGIWKTMVIFPATGDYELMLIGKRKDSAENKYIGIAALSFKPLVPEGSGLFGFGLEGSGMDGLLLLEGIRNGEGEWSPNGNTRFTKFKTGTIAGDRMLTLKGNRIPLRKGAGITFFTDGSKIYDLAFSLGDDVPYQIVPNNLIFKKGTVLYIGKIEVVGFLAEKTDIESGSAQILVPAGSRIFFSNERLYRVELAGPGLITIGDTKIPCRDFIAGSPWSKNESLYFNLAEPAFFSVGDTSFTAPAGTALGYTNGVLSRADFIEKVILTIKGKAVQVEAKNAVIFNSDGSIADMFEMKFVE